MGQSRHSITRTSGQLASSFAENFMRVLLVEDETQMASFISKGLREEGFAVDVATDGQECLYLAEVNEYDIVTLDVRLPLKDGITVCRELRERALTTPILML